MAYFEVFENLEAQFVSISPTQKSYQMEATFGRSNKMIGEGSSQKRFRLKSINSKELKKCCHHWLKAINSMPMDNMAFMIINRCPIGNKVLKPLMT